LRKSKKKTPKAIGAVYPRLIKASFFVVGSFVLPIAVGSLLARALLPMLASAEFVTDAVAAASIVGIFLLISGFGYRRWCFSTTRDCAIGVTLYVLASMLFVAYVTGSDAVAGLFEGWFFWLAIATLAPWFAGFWLADRSRFRSRKHA